MRLFIVVRSKINIDNGLRYLLSAQTFSSYRHGYAQKNTFN